MAAALLTSTARTSREDALRFATDLFVAHERVDLRRIAQDLGVGRTTLYRWFGDREQLLGEVIGDLNEIAWAVARAQAGSTGMTGLLDAVDRFAEVTATFEPARHFARTEPSMAIRVLLDPDGRIRQDMVARVRDELAEHAEPHSYAPETPDLLVEVSIALVWTPITIGRTPDLERLHDLLQVLTPPGREDAA